MANETRQNLNPLSVATNPVSSALGAAVGGTIGTASGATFLASEMAKLGNSVAGRPGEISGAALGASTGAAIGFAVGAGLGAISGLYMVQYVLSGSKPTIPTAALPSSTSGMGQVLSNSVSALSTAAGQAANRVSAAIPGTGEPATSATVPGSDAHDT